MPDTDTNIMALFVLVIYPLSALHLFSNGWQGRPETSMLLKLISPPFNATA